MGVGVKLGNLFLLIVYFSSCVYSSGDVVVESPQVDVIHSVHKRDLADPRIDWSESQPYLDGPHTDQITIKGIGIFMDEEMDPPVTIARLNYKGPGVATFRFTIGSNDNLGLTAERREDEIFLISNKKQDFEAGHVFYRIEITVTEGDINKRQLLELEINNIDDNPPVVIAPPCAVDELYVGVTDCVFTIQDKDGIISTSMMILKIVGSEIVEESFNLVDRVDIDQYEFTIKLNVVKELEFVVSQLHVFDLVAIDSGNNEGSAQVIVRVNDVPNEPPMWQTIFATQTFDEKTTQTFTVKAIDGDTGINKPICYALEMEFEDPVIKIDAENGVISVEPIDRDRLEQEVFLFDIVAYKCDNRSWTTVSNTVFLVNDVNDQIPKVVTSNFEISILEETYVSLDFPEIITVHDRDLALNARYSVKLESVSPPDAANAFLVIPRDGYQRQEFQIAIIDASKLDYDTAGWETVKLKVIATEEKDPTHIGTATVTIHLENWNDEKPIFTQDSYTAELKETVEADVFVAKVFATDRDVGDEVTHSIRGSAQEYLSINPATGEVRVKINDAFDYDRQQEVVVQVEARDMLNSSTSAVNVVLTQLTINIIDVNNKPPQITMPRELTQVEEHVKDGTVITEGIIGSDLDTDAEIWFTIDWDSSYATKQGRLVQPEVYKGCVDIQTIHTDASSKRNAKGRLIAKQIGEREIDTLDFEDIEVLYLSIVLRDHKTVVGVEYTQAILAINIEDINDNPPVWNPETSSTEYFVREEADKDTVIGSVQATDIDGPKYNVISYFIKPKSGTLDDLVKINPANGQITVMLDKTISADLPPTFYLYYTLTASDCTEETGPDCHNVDIDIKIFIIDTNSQTPYEEENENVDKDTENIVRIKEHSDEGSYVTTILGNDLDRDDPYNKVSYIIDYRTLPQLEKVFAVDINTGRITTKLPIDLERDYGTTEYVVPVLMIDNYYLEKDRTQRTNSTSVKVVLIDINDNAPKFEPLDEGWSISEEAAANTNIGTIRAHDIDEEGTPRSQINFKILSVSKVNSDGKDVPDDTDIFDIRTISINEPTYKYGGQLFAKKKLESYWGTYKIVIEAHDMAEDEEIQRSRVTQQVTVEPFNFNAPTFVYPADDLTIRLSLEEATFGRLRYASNGSMLSRVSAIDEDGGDAGRVSFEITEDESSKKFFSVDNLANNEAEFILNEPILEASRYTVTLVATDHGVPPLSSSITFTFEVMSTDSMPQFLESQFVTSFTESSKGQEERQVLPEAVDPLEGRPLYYYIADYKDLFSVNKNTREMKLQEGKELNRSEKDKYEIRYRVAIVDPDIEGNPRYNEMKVIIQVREADPKPMFELQQYTGGISIIDDTGKKVTSVKAHHSENLVITYAIDLSSMEVDPSLENVKDQAFRIVSKTGDIFLGIKPLATMKGQFKFDVTATDTNEVTSKASVVVFIVSEDNRITFTFFNMLEEVERERASVQRIFSEEFGYECSIDTIVMSTNSEGVALDKQTDVRTHFMENGIAITANVIEEKRGDIVFLGSMVMKFEEVGLRFGDFSSGSTIIEESLEKMLQIILIVVSSVLGVLCVLLVVAFCLRTRSLNRRLEALSTTKFGSQDSGLNRTGVNVPGTNKHALEGSNPVWNEDIKAPNFDELSNYSGDSDLIGIEDDPQFAFDNKGYNGNIGNTLSSETPTKRNTHHKIGNFNA